MDRAPEDPRLRPGWLMTLRYRGQDVEVFATTSPAKRWRRYEWGGRGYKTLEGVQAAINRERAKGRKPPAARSIHAVSGGLPSLGKKR